MREKASFIMNTQTNNTLRIALVGDKRVGKSTWMNRLTTGKFETRYIPTKGVHLWKLDLANVKFEVYDISGQETILNSIGRCDGCIIMFELSFKNISRWMNYVTSVFGDKIPICAIANKCGMGMSSRKINKITTYELEPLLWFIRD